MVFSSGSGVPPAPAAAVAGGTGGWPASSPPCGTGAATASGAGAAVSGSSAEASAAAGAGGLPRFRGRQAVPQGPELQRLRPGPWQGPGPEGCPPEVRGWRQTLLPPEQRAQSRLAPSGGQSRARYRKSRQERPCPRQRRAGLRPQQSCAGPRKRQERPVRES